MLQTLRGPGRAEWRPFDWDADDWDTDIVPLAASRCTARSHRSSLLEGAYSARPELHDLLDLRVLLDTPTDLRLRRLLAWEGESYQADWSARWSGAEDHYFGTVMPHGHFDLVLTPAADDARPVTFAP